ncbi:unnamed protein product, partial [Brenthis ino]
MNLTTRWVQFVVTVLAVPAVAGSSPAGGIHLCDEHESTNVTNTKVASESARRGLPGPARAPQGLPGPARARQTPSAAARGYASLTIRNKRVGVSGSESEREKEKYQMECLEQFVKHCKEQIKLKQQRRETKRGAKETARDRDRSRRGAAPVPISYSYTQP